MSTISAGTTLTTALINAGDTTGDLQLQVNGTTPSLTLKADGSIGLGATPTYGTAGQVLTSGGTGAAPTWSTPPVTSAATPTTLGTVYGKTVLNVNYGNVSLGYGSLVTTSYPDGSTTAIGTNCLNKSLGWGNIGLGDNVADGGNLTGNENILIGSYSASVASSAEGNAIIGHYAGYNLTTGDYNVMLGYGAGSNVTTGQNNVLIGENSGGSLATGSNNIVIGKSAVSSATGVSNEITLGNTSITSLRIPGLQVGKSAGDVLTFDGSKITLATPSGGSGLVKISTLTASASSSLEWTNLSGYNNYLIVFNKLMPTTTTSLFLTVGYGATPTYVSSGYTYMGTGVLYNKSTTAFSSNTGGLASFSNYYLAGAIGNLLNTGIGFNGQVYLNNFTNSGILTLNNIVEYETNTYIYQENSGGFVSGDTNVKTAIKIAAASGTLASGSATLYGLA